MRWKSPTRWCVAELVRKYLESRRCNATWSAQMVKMAAELLMVAERRPAVRRRLRRALREPGEQSQRAPGATVFTWTSGPTTFARSTVR